MKGRLLKLSNKNLAIALLNPKVSKTVRNVLTKQDIWKKDNKDLKEHLDKLHFHQELVDQVIYQKKKSLLFLKKKSS